MAGNAQIRFLKKKGVNAWNAWRKANVEVRPDFGWANLKNANLQLADLSGADLNGANLSLAKLNGADFSGTNLNGANLNEADLRLAVFLGANLSGAKLAGANLAGANLSKTDMRGADLSSADLSSADLRRADLRNADLSRTNLFGADLTYADLMETDFTNSFMIETQLGNVNLSQAGGVETVEHFAPSTIGIDTIYLSGGNIPDVFLRGAGIPEAFIIHMKSLVGAMSPIEFYSCFISYSSKDENLAERLNTDLRSRGVRCWFAPEDLKIGAKLRSSFDEAIRIHDKLMVLLSENSVKSQWVEKEVETAFEKERQQNRTVLFPIRLDDAVMETDQAWAGDIRRTRHIGDFRNWKHHDSYIKAFDRLLRDLKSEVKPNAPSRPVKRISRNKKGNSGVEGEGAREKPPKGKI